MSASQSTPVSPQDSSGEPREILALTVTPPSADGPVAVGTLALSAEGTVDLHEIHFEEARPALADLVEEIAEMEAVPVLGGGAVTPWMTISAADRVEPGAPGFGDALVAWLEMQGFGVTRGDGAGDETQDGTQSV